MPIFFRFLLTYLRTRMGALDFLYEYYKVLVTAVFTRLKSYLMDYIYIIFDSGIFHSYDATVSITNVLPLIIGFCSTPHIQCVAWYS